MSVVTIGDRCTQATGLCWLPVLAKMFTEHHAMEMTVHILVINKQQSVQQLTRQKNATCYQWSQFINYQQKHHKDNSVNLLPHFSISSRQNLATSAAAGWYDIVELLSALINVLPRSTTPNAWWHAFLTCITHYLSLLKATITKSCHQQLQICQFIALVQC